MDGELRIAAPEMDNPYLTFTQPYTDTHLHDRGKQTTVNADID